MQRLWLTGYRSYELGIFDPKDPKLEVIKYSLKNKLTQAVEDGLTWLITGGQLGIEQWSLEVAQTLKVAYPELKTALMLPFMDFGQQWNEANQAQLTQLKNQVDFTATTSNSPYTTPTQLQQYQQFMLAHTDGALLYYDNEAQGKSQYDLKVIQRFQERHDYPLDQVDFFDLQDFAEELADQERETF